MGGQSEKKIQQKKAQVIGYYTYSTLACSGLYLAQVLYSGQAFEIYGVLFALFVLFISFFCYKQIDRSLDLGLDVDSYSIYIDILVLNDVIQVGSWLTDFIFYLYLIFPFYLIYKLGGLCWGWVSNMQYVDDKQPKKKEKRAKH